MGDDVTALLERAMTAVEPVVASVGADDHDRPTPCPGFDLAALLGHVVGGLRGFGDVGEGLPLRFDLDPDVRVEPVADEYRRAADRLLAAFARPGVVERTYAMPWGDTTGQQLLGFELIELVVHGWDICRSLGRALVVDSDIVEATLRGAQMWVDDSARTPQLFGPEVSSNPEAPVLERLVAFLGRHPEWSVDTP